MSEPAALHVVLAGRVQGVAFRAFVLRKAIPLGVTGYVKNLLDGQVEVVAEGDRQPLERLLLLLKQGPPGARIDHVAAGWSSPTGSYRSFVIEF